MKLGAVPGPDGPRYGIVEGASIAVVESRERVLEMLGGAPAPTAPGQRLPWDESGVLDVPVPVASVRDFITFEQHTAGSLRAVTGADEVPDAWYEAPAFYFTNPHAAIGSGVDVPVPPGCEVLDFELEVGAVIGKAGYNLTVEEAADHIAGLTILNDWSARDLQSTEMRVGLGPAKGKDTATTLGPVVVTVDELTEFARGDGRWDLTMRVFVDDVEIGSDSLANMAWSFAELVAYASRGTWVRPGDVLGSGTCGGGCLAELWGWAGERRPAPLRVGNTVRMSVQGIGEIHNTVVAGPPLHPVAPAARTTRARPPQVASASQSSTSGGGARSAR